MIRDSKTKNGFSAVELLITLVVGSLFIIMGYQLYSVTIVNGGEVRQEAKAGNLAYSKLRQLSINGTGVAVCPGSPTITTANVDSNNAVQTTTISCPYPATFPKIRLAIVNVKYNVSLVEASHAVYVTEP